jgi:hypothetical protein
VILALAVILNGQVSVSMPKRLAVLLQEGKWDSTPRGFRFMALSFIADGCAEQAKADAAKQTSARRCIEQAFAVANSLLGPDRVDTSRNGLILTHINLILGAADAVGGSCLDEQMHRQLSRHLAQLSLQDKYLHAPSYADVQARWPADQSATLASLSRYDRAHHDTLHEEPADRWKRFFDSKSIDKATELPISEVTGTRTGSNRPRGCAQSYLTRYVSEFDTALAARWYANYKAHFADSVMRQPGFREWPRGVSLKADIDSGPIIFGIGAAASAFGIIAAKSQGDPLGNRLESTADRLLSLGVGGSSGQTLLALSIRFLGHWQTAVASAGPTEVPRNGN